MLWYANRTRLIGSRSLQAAAILLDCRRQNSGRDNHRHAGYQCNNYGCVFHKYFFGLKLTAANLRHWMTTEMRNGVRSASLGVIRARTRAKEHAHNYG